jgi:hypothetical protein
VQQVGLVHNESAVEQFGSAGSDPAFHDRVHPWYADPGRDYCDAVVGKNGVEGGGVLALSGCRCPWVLWVVRTRLWLRRWPGQAVVGKATISFQVASRVSISRR